MCLYEAQNSGERLQDNWSSGYILYVVTAAGVVLCGSPKISSYIVHSAVYIFLLVL